MRQAIIYLESSVEEDWEEALGDTFERYKDRIEINNVSKIYEQGSFVLVENLEGDCVRIPHANVRYIYETNRELKQN